MRELILVPVLLFKFANSAPELKSTDCICPMIYSPVKCDNGKTYGNECEANCDKAVNCENTLTLTTTAKPVVPKVCVCPEIYQPVKCGNKQDFSNMCYATCKGFNKSDCKETKICTCPRIYNPVTCGKDQVQYANTCEADCQGEIGCKNDAVTKACKNFKKISRRDQIRCKNYSKISKKMIKENSKKKPNKKKMKRFSKVMKQLETKLSAISKNF